MSRIGFSVTGLDEVKAIFGNLSASQQKVIKKEFEEAIKETSYLMRRDAPVDQARLKNSITYQVTNDLKGQITTNVFYSPFLEFGTKKQVRVPSEISSYAAQFRGPYNSAYAFSFPEVNPIEALMAWIKRKGIAATYSIRTQKRTKRTKSEAKTERQLAFVIWRKIKRDGIKAQPYFFTSKAGTFRMDQVKTLLTDRLTSGIKLLLKQ